MKVEEAQACCITCAESDCDEAEDFIEEAHEDIRERVKTEFDDDLDQFEDWLIEVMLETQFLPAIAAMLNQMGSVAMQYTEIVGSFLDAQHQMDTQRLIRKLQFDAHKDYRPSEGFCYFGTNVRSLAASQNIARFNSLALSRMSLDRQMGQVNTAGSVNAEGDYRARWGQFVDTYCDVGDNNRDSSTTGLQLACDRDGPGGATDAGAEVYDRYNRDIDYTRLIEEPRTLNIDMEDDELEVTAEPYDSLIISPIEEPGDEEDIIAMSKNLFGHQVLSRELSRVAMEQDTAQKLYLALRSVAAKRNVAQTSFNSIVGLKSSGTSHEPTGLYAHPGVIDLPLNVAGGTLIHKQTRRFMAAIMDQLLPANTLLGEKVAFNIYDLIGYSPSYFAQLEVLAKRIYQNPSFYANLYDTPANVARKRVAMKAIELMVDRAIYESQLRREMSVSVLLSSKLRASHRRVNENLANAKGKN